MLDDHRTMQTDVIYMVVQRLLCIGNIVSYLILEDCHSHSVAGIDLQVSYLASAKSGGAYAIVKPIRISRNHINGILRFGIKVKNNYVCETYHDGSQSLT